MSVGFVSAPHNATYTTWPATEKQISFLKKLMAGRVVGEDLSSDVAFELEQPSGPGKSAVSQLIDDLLNCPAKPTHVSGPSQKLNLPAIPAGRYAVEDAVGKLRFLRVDRPEDGAWKGWVFVSVQAGDEFYRLKGEQPKKALAAIEAAGAKAASVRYGHEIGACGICGRTLTNEDSRLAGIGPVCAGKVGW